MNSSGRKDSSGFLCGECANPKMVWERRKKQTTTLD
jgi:hypothetical protein